MSDYSWIKPGVLAVVTGTYQDPNGGAVVEVLSNPSWEGSYDTWSGRVLPQELVAEVSAITPIRFGEHDDEADAAVVPCHCLRPLPDFPEIAEEDGISVKEPVT